jgi:heme exporter protein A
VTTTASTTAPMAVSLHSVRHTFGRTSALLDIGLDVAWGECVALFGHNGAGKTTLLRIMATLLKPTSGTMQMAGHPYPGDRSLIRAATGFLGHQPLLYDDLTSRENLRFYGRLFDVSDVESRVSEVLEAVGMERMAERRVRTLSNGMQKRVALARALLHRPKVLLLDEPETGLDQASLTLLEQVLKDSLQTGASIVMATHDVDFGLRLAHRAVVIDGGRVVKDVPASEMDADALRELLAGHREHTP